MALTAWLLAIRAAAQLPQDNFIIAVYAYALFRAENETPKDGVVEAGNSRLGLNLRLA